MDLSRYDTREKSHEGVEIIARIDGEPITGDDDKPILWRIRGLADPEVHRLILQGRQSGSRTPDEVLQADLKLARIAVVGWSDNLSLDGEKVPFSKDAIARVFAIPLVRQAVLREVASDFHFMKGS